jgi:hypothetical protein
VLACDFDDYRKHSGNSQGTVRDQSGISQGTFSEQSGKLQYNECLVATLLTTGNTQGTFKEHSGNIQGSVRDQSGNTQGSVREHSVNTQGIFSITSAWLRL